VCARACVCASCDHHLSCTQTDLQNLALIVDGDDNTCARRNSACCVVRCVRRCVELTIFVLSLCDRDHAEDGASKGDHITVQLSHARALEWIENVEVVTEGECCVRVVDGDVRVLSRSVA
jgi:hypothetical protein